MIYHPEATPRRTPALTSIIDIPPTVLDVFNTEHSGPVEGNSLLPIVLDGGDQNHDYAITHGAWVGGWSPDGGNPQGQVTDGEWTLLLENQGPPDKLYHLPSDPGQNENRFESSADEVRRLYDAFLNFIDQNGGPPEMVESFRNRMP